MSNSSDELSVLTLFGRVRRQANLRVTHGLRPLGIGPKQALFIRELRNLKAACPMELARVTLTDPAATGKILQSLIKKDWIKRTDDPNDRRRWQVSLTPRGEKTAQKLDGIYREFAGEFCKPMLLREKEILLKVLDKISSHLETTLKQAGDLT